MEQKRAVLQSIKDFDFQIKKNSEEIGGINQKLELLSKDLDDLVSLYEIVSEQMNPFVGLSKVTKKRIDALENFTNEIEDVKSRMGDVESVLEKNKGVLGELKKTTRKPVEPKKKVESEIDDLIFEINLENDCLITALYFSQEELEKGPLSESPLYKKILQEGISL